MHKSLKQSDHPFRLKRQTYKNMLGIEFKDELIEKPCEPNVQKESINETVVIAKISKCPLCCVVESPFEEKIGTADCLTRSPAPLSLYLPL